MELSFGEQVKIILKRKNMSIQDLALLYEMQTRKNMSRQNLTQRLNRDNFPEQDMRLIASLLGYDVSIALTPTPVTSGMPGVEKMPADVSPAPVSAAAENNNSAQTAAVEEEKAQAPIGDINPHTGEEYMSNTVRKHPTLAGYVQVYDRYNHEWTDVEEKPFWDFQESKKEMLGRDYQEPIVI